AGSSRTCRRRRRKGGPSAVRVAEGPWRGGRRDRVGGGFGFGTCHSPPRETLLPELVASLIAAKHLDQGWLHRASAEFSDALLARSRAHPDSRVFVREDPLNGPGHP